MAGKGKGGNVASVVTALAAPIAAQLGLELWDVRFLKEGASYVLRIIIDKEGGINISDCEAFSNAIDAPLDAADPIEQSYHLEVSSPGLERELTKPAHFERFLGAPVMVRLIRPVDGVRDFKGTLTSFADNVVTVTPEDGEAFSFQKKDASFIKLDDFD